MHEYDLIADWCHGRRSRFRRRQRGSVARVLKPDGFFLFTAGYPIEAGEDSDGQVGQMHGVEFRYYSFTQDGYRRVLEDHGLSLIDFHTDEGQNGYYLARKTT